MILVPRFQNLSLSCLPLHYTTHVGQIFVSDLSSVGADARRAELGVIWQMQMQIVVATGAEPSVGVGPSLDAAKI